MPVWQWLADSAGIILLVLLFLVAALVVRRRLISRHDGTFELSVRDGSLSDGRGWVLGLGRYREDSLEWYRIFSPLPVPKRSWRRSDLNLVSQRVPRKAEEFALYAGSVVVVCTTPRGETELAMSRSSLTGLQSWLEAGPPGTSPAI
jgi:hypothetical protein